LDGTVEGAARRRVAIEMVAKHERALLRTARRYSICAEDADDALQRALEILLTKAPPGEARELVRWMQTVTKHEALAIRRSRERQLGTPRPSVDPEETVDWVSLIPSTGAGPAERAERHEEIARTREGLKTLKPAELRALTLLAQGYSYSEIGEITGWTRTKINRSLAEGRERFRAFLSRSDAGERCAELAPLLSAYCDEEADAAEAALVREHLRACAHCRAAIRAYRTAPHAARVLAPAPLAAGALLRRVHDALGRLGSRLPWQGRANAESAAAQVAAGGGARGAGVTGLAKLFAICAGTAGGAAACVGAGVLPAPVIVPANHPALARPAAALKEAPVPQESLVPSEAAEPTPEPSEKSAPTNEKDEPEPVTETVAATPVAEAGAVEYTPPPAPAPEAAPPSAAGSGSPAGEFGP
jgi:RNA polymerase sigma factor (sigma-70 family)